MRWDVGLAGRVLNIGERRFWRRWVRFVGDREEGGGILKE